MKRVCSQCGGEFPETTEFFYKHKVGRGGLRAECKKCSYAFTLKRKETNLEEHRAMIKRCTARRKKKMAEYNKKRYEEKKEQILAVARKWKVNNRDKVNIGKQRRRALIRNLPASFTDEHWKQCKDSFDNKCCYCGKRKVLSQDHFISVHNGGEYTINNIVPACKTCNSGKQEKDFFEWYPNQPFYSEVRQKRILKYLNYQQNTQQLALL